MVCETQTLVRDFDPATLLWYDAQAKAWEEALFLPEIQKYIFEGQPIKGNRFLFQYFPFQN